MVTRGTQSPGHGGPRRVHAALTAVIWGATIVVCGGDPASQESGSEASHPLFFGCAEARGALYELGQMANGSEAVDSSTVGYGATAFRRLAEEVSGPAEVMRDIDAWSMAVDAWGNARTAVPPTFVGGRLIEPDTTEIDQALMNSVLPIAERLSAWHADVCGEP